MVILAFLYSLALTTYKNQFFFDGTGKVDCSRKADPTKGLNFSIGDLKTAFLKRKNVLVGLINLKHCILKFDSKG